MGVAQAAVFTQVGKCYDIARFIEIATLIGNPHFHASDIDTGRDEGELGAPFIIVVAEEVREEEIAILVVAVGCDIKRGGLCTTLGVDGLGL